MKKMTNITIFALIILLLLPSQAFCAEDRNNQSSTHKDFDSHKLQKESEIENRRKNVIESIQRDEIIDRSPRSIERGDPCNIEPTLPVCVSKEHKG